MNQDTIHVGFCPVASAPGYSSKTIFQSWQPANFCKHTTDSTAFKKLRSPEKYYYDNVGTSMKTFRPEYTNLSLKETLNRLSKDNET